MVALNYLHSSTSRYINYSALNINALSYTEWSTVINNSYDDKLQTEMQILFVFISFKIDCYIFVSLLAGYFIEYLITNDTGSCLLNVE